MDAHQEPFFVAPSKACTIIRQEVQSAQTIGWRGNAPGQCHDTAERFIVSALPNLLCNPQDSIPELPTLIVSERGVADQGNQHIPVILDSVIAVDVRRSLVRVTAYPAPQRNLTAIARRRSLTPNSG